VQPQTIANAGNSLNRHIEDFYKLAREILDNFDEVMYTPDKMKWIASRLQDTYNQGVDETIIEIGKLR
jgi:hypothetical protein